MNLQNLPLRMQLLLIILVSNGNLVMAQDINENNFTLYTKQQGLSHNIITSVTQDSTGYLWIATASGLNRFNGSNFVQFHSTNDSLSLPQENLLGLVWLDKQRLAVYTNVGLHIINTSSGETRNLFVPYIDKRYQYKFNSIMSVQANPAGDFFLLTRAGFCHYNKNCELLFRFDYYPKEAVAIESFYFGGRLLWLDDHRLAMTTIDGLYFYDITEKKIKKMEATDFPLLGEFTQFPKSRYEFFQKDPGSVFIITPYCDSIIYIDFKKNRKVISHLPFHKIEFDYRSEVTSFNDTVLFITGNTSGLYKMKFNPVNGKVSFDEHKYFSSYSCRRLLQDKANNFWIATNKGLLKQDNTKVQVQQAVIPSSIQDSFPNIRIDDLVAVGNKLFVATRGGNCGLLVFDKKQFKFSRRINFNKFKRVPNSILALAPLNATTLLVGTNGPLFKLNTNTFEIEEMILPKWNKEFDWIADIYKDKKGKVWVASDSIYYYDAATRKFNILPSGKDLFEKIQKPNLIGEDASGNIWTAGHGLSRYNIALKKYDLFIDSFPYIKIPNRQINTFLGDSKNNLWINGNNNGLSCYNIEKGTYRHFTRDDGLPDNNIEAMIIVRDKLWLAGFSGIGCLDLKTFLISSFGKEDGFPDLPVFNGSKFYYDSSLDKLYIGLSSTIVQFDPDIAFQRSQVPKLFIESLTTGDQKVIHFPENNFTTDWNNNEITITIGSINFFTSNSQQFAYRLLKDDNSQWQQLGSQNIFSISGLSPGHHRVQVKLFSLSNRWPAQVKEIEIIILPPFWKRTWFILLMASVFVLTAYLLLTWRTGLIRKKERAKAHLQELKLEEYKSQFELEQISHYFSSSLAGKKNVEEVLWDVAKNLIGRMNYKDCMIYLWNDDKTKMVQTAAYGPKGDPEAIMEKVFDVAPGEGVVGHVMQTKEPLLINDTRWDRRYRVDDIRRLSELCVPIIHNDELIGVIDSEHPDENHFKERDIKILTTIATLVGNKIVQIESEQSLEIKQKEIAFINQQLAEAQLSALQTQMNPHFIFNSLNSIKGMILANEQQKASRYLSKFAQMIRITLNQSKEIFTTLYENIEHLENYLLMEKLRFDDSFSFQIIVDEQIDKEETLVPTLMIQPLAENAIWHGLLHKEGQKNLIIRFARVGEMISCIIEDNGIGIRRSEELKKINRQTHQSVGLNNLRNRIKIMNEKYDTGCTLDITDLQDIDKAKTGTRAVLRFSITINKPFL